MCSAWLYDYDVFYEAIWKDEVFVFNLIKHPYSYFLLSNRDTAPPLHFVIVNFAVDIGKKLFPAISSIVIGKLVSAVPFIVLVIFAITRIRKLFITFCFFTFREMLLDEGIKKSIECAIFGALAAFRMPENRIYIFVFEL